LDVSARVVETVNQGRIHIVEPDLDRLVRAAVKTGRLRATLSPEPADAFLVAVLNEHGLGDLAGGSRCGRT
jgi:UDP-N-acetyl-D-mannosaminuronic acid dehydrogenase